MRFASRLSVWVALFMGGEELVDQLRGEGGRRDVLSTVCAGLGTAGVYSYVSGAVTGAPSSLASAAAGPGARSLDMYTAARFAKTALKVSIGYGLAQDLVATIRGNRPDYVDWVMGTVLGLERGRQHTDEEPGRDKLVI
jgi:hypothetical protein